MESVEALARRLTPSQTVLLLGAGASVPSGAPTGAQLAKHLAGKLDPIPDSDDLSEVGTIFEHRQSRRELIEAIRARLSALTPAGGLLLIPEFDWRSIYSTNFDRLVETAYSRAGMPIPVIRSNYDWSRGHSGRALYKIHGCMSQDVSLGQKHRMVITERDYDQVEEYHEALFTALAAEMLTCDTLIIGQSLADKHLKELAKRASKLNANSGTPGRVYLLSYSGNPDTALVYEQWGIDVTTGSLDTLLHAVAEVHEPLSRASSSGADKVSSERDLPPELVAATIDCLHASKLLPNARNLFNGAAASYADIKAGLTIERAIEPRLLDSQKSAQMLCTALIGNAGVGKTSLARRMIFNRQDQDFVCWEHNNSFQLNPAAWLKVEENLRQHQRQGFLLVDDCTEQLVAVNRLIDGLAAKDRPHLRLVLTATSSQWQSRRKTPKLFARSHIEKMSRLTSVDIDRFVNLVEREQPIRALVEENFLNLNHQQRVSHLRDRCNSEMYVCLKNVFGFEELDDILLKEFKELAPDLQDIYRYVCAIQAMGGKVHRQLIVRLLGIDAGQLMARLNDLDGIVLEHEINRERGIYGWSSRHDVIATKIAEYKFGDPQEQRELLRDLISGLNPTVWVELETANAMATSPMGIDRLPDAVDQIELLTDLVKVVPAERTPRRRLIRRYLHARDTGAAKQAIEAADREIGSDDIVDRYKIRLILIRAENQKVLMLEDRVSLLFEARSQALKLVHRRPDDRHNYRILCDVGLALLRLNGDPSVLEEGISAIAKVEDDIADPELVQDRKSYEQLLRSEAAV